MRKNSFKKILASFLAFLIIASGSSIAFAEGMQEMQNQNDGFYETYKMNRNFYSQGHEPGEVYVELNEEGEGKATLSIIGGYIDVVFNRYHPEEELVEARFIFQSFENGISGIRMDQMTVENYDGSYFYDEVLPPAGQNKVVRTLYETSKTGSTLIDLFYIPADVSKVHINIDYLEVYDIKKADWVRCSPPFGWYWPIGLK